MVLICPVRGDRYMAVLKQNMDFSKEMRLLRIKLDFLAEKGYKQGKLEYDPASAHARVVKELGDTNSRRGKRLYQSFTDQELCKILVDRMMQLGHVPAQKEVFWVYRFYIKKRFKTWPAALSEAGLNKNAGAGGSTTGQVIDKQTREKQFISEIREAAKKYGRPPHMYEIRGAAAFFKERFKTWAEVLELAGVKNHPDRKSDVYAVFKVDNFTDQERSLLKQVYEMARELGRPPMRCEVPKEVKEALKVKCKTWRNALYQLGLEPVQNLYPFSATYLDDHDREKQHKEILTRSVFKLVEPGEETRKQLEYLRNTAKKLGRPPIRKEIPEEIYKNLIESCVSYRNILYQIGLTPLSKPEEKKIEQMMRKKKKQMDSRQKALVKVKLVRKEESDDRIYENRHA